MEETISLQEIFSILKKNLWIMLIGMFVCLGIAGFLTFIIITPKYSATTQMIVTLPTSDQQDVNDVNANLMMINTYKTLITSNAVLDKAQEQLKTAGDFDGTVADLKAMITVDQETDSQIFSIDVESENAKEAAAIANTTASVFQEQAKELTNVDKISVISQATANTTPVSPNNRLNLAIGAVLGLMIGIGLAFVREFMDKTVKDDSFITETLQYANLGTVPKMSAKEQSFRYEKNTLDSKEDNHLSRAVRKRI